MKTLRVTPSILTDPELTDLAVRVLLVLLNCRDRQTGIAKISLDGIAKRARRSRSQVATTVKLLERLGYIENTETRSRSCALFRFLKGCESPAPAVRKNLADNDDGGCSTTDDEVDEQADARRSLYRVLFDPKTLEHRRLYAIIYSDTAKRVDSEIRMNFAVEANDQLKTATTDDERERIFNELSRKISDAIPQRQDAA
jgi:hypothetical protein